MIKDVHSAYTRHVLTIAEPFVVTLLSEPGQLMEARSCHRHDAFNTHGRVDRIARVANRRTVTLNRFVQS